MIVNMENEYSFHCNHCGKLAHIRMVLPTDDGVVSEELLENKIARESMKIHLLKQIKQIEDYEKLHG